MEKTIYLFIHLGLPMVMLADVLLRPGRTKIGTIARGSSYTLILAFLYLWGQWAIVGSYYLKCMVILIMLICLRRMIVDLRSGLPLLPTAIVTHMVIGAGFILSFFFTYLVVSVYQGRSYPEVGVEWEFPLGPGKYYVSSGGSTKIVNNHIRTHMTSQHYAIDINKLGTLLGVSKGMLSANPKSHHIYGESVFAPCAGKIIKVKSHVPDRTISTMAVSPEDGTGNFVELDCNGVIVSIPHLMHNSVTVVPGQQIEVGTHLAKIGLSGFAQEPHLHIQAAKYGADSTLVGTPITFNTRQLVRNDIIEIK